MIIKKVTNAGKGIFMNISYNEMEYLLIINDTGKHWSVLDFSDEFHNSYKPIYDEKLTKKLDKAWQNVQFLG